MNVNGHAYLSLRLRGFTPYAPAFGVNPPEWTLDAICQQFDPEAFHPEKGGSAIEAKKICSLCTVRDECLAENIEDRYGIFGGTSERERRRLLKSGWKPGDPAPEIAFPNHGRNAVA